MKKKIYLTLMIFAVFVLGLTGCGKQKTYEVTLEMGENYVFDACAIFGVDEAEAEKYVPVLETLDTNTAGKYEVKVVKGTTEYTVIYTVEDTKAPEVKMKQRYIFVNNVDTADLSVLANVRDASDTKETLCKFEFIEVYKALGADAGKKYAKSIVDTNDVNKLLQRLDDTVGADGVYSAVYLVEDAYGHKTAKEVIVIYDTTAPVINGIENIPETVTSKDEEWTETYVNKLNVTDNCDGVIKADALDVKMEKKDANSNIYSVEASYTDRAGNKTTAKYDIKVDFKNSASSKGDNKDNDDEAEKNSTTLRENDKTNNNATNNGGAGNNNSNSGSASNNNHNNSSSNTTVYSVEDRDGDGYADLGATTEFNGFLMPTEQVTVDTAKLDQAVCNAGYYNPVRWNNGCTYMIVPYGEFDKGVEFLINFATQNGIPLNSFGGGNWDLMGVAEFVYID